MTTAARPDVYFRPLGPCDGGGERYLATEHTAGPWDPRSQHGGPPSALLARAIERESPSWPGTVVRMAVDILGPVPVGDLELRSTLLRPGRSVDLVAAELVAGGRSVVRAHGWRIRVDEVPLPPSYDGLAAQEVPPLPVDETALPARWTGGYLHSMEWRVARGSWGEPGAATVWGRMRHPLVPDEEPTGLQRLMAIADSGSGVSNVLPVGEWLFINPELTVHVLAPTASEWICLDAETRVDPSGFGLATSRLWDPQRLVGRGAQSLLVSPMPAAR